MKGDFTRSTFKSQKHYSSVRMQQGRVQIDADWNEQIEIQTYLDQTQARDVIGLCGVPKIGGGFAIGVNEDGTDLTISEGRIYVDGILCENDGPQPVLFTQQPDLPGTTPPGDPGTYLVYLDVWQRHITALEDETIREVALGGPDTATRTRTVWQVKLLRVGDANADVTCETEFEEWTSLIDAERGKLSARAQVSEPSDSPCIIEPGAGYRRLENQLYRVEIHNDSDSGQPTFKWSRDNGSIVRLWAAKNGDDLTISSAGRDSFLGFATGQWVELTDDNRELLGDPGTLVQLANAIGQTLTIDPATASGTVDFTAFDEHPKVRRWDMPGTTGPIEVSVPAGNGGWIALEDGVEIKFDLSGPFRTGDYWLIPARTATANVEWPFADPQPPHGVRHHYCRLALINFEGEALTADSIQDCRIDFPSLTTICAEDVCFDNTSCDLQDVVTVQDAIDRLCAERDLRHHNKHLHGWGIVCGLNVTCGPNDDNGRRNNVTIHTGYAIDCEGNDILVERDTRFQVMREIRRLMEQNPDLKILDDKGNGEVSLILERDGSYRLAPYDPKARNELQALLAGTLLLDFYNDCIKPIQDFLEEQLQPPPNEEKEPAGPTYQRLSALTNLVAQPVNQQTGQHIYLSPREHRLIEEFYIGLRDLLTSETFCAMFANARPLPDYPLRDLGISQRAMDTIFGRSQHVRLRMRPGGAEVYSVGPGSNPLKPDTTINRYDVNKNVLIERINPIAGAQIDDNQSDTGTGAVQDVAFSPDGRLIYMIAATKSDENTFFRVGEIGRTGITWRPMVTICDVKLVTLATTPADRTNVYAIGLRKQTITDPNGTTRTQFRGAGLYQINPDNVNPNMEPMPGQAFNTFGHLEISANGRAFVTFRTTDTQPTSYNAVRAIQLPGGTTIREFPLELSGSDDIAIFTAAEEARTETLFVVTGPDSNNRKLIQGFNIANGQQLGDGVPMPNTTIRLEPFAPQRMLLVTLENNYSVRMISMDALRAIDGYLLPTQVSPVGITSTSGIRNIREQRVYVLNQLSNTITTVAGELFNPEFRFRLDVLAAYRKGVLEAFADLLGGFLQYLKDCLCDHFLVKCPQCDEDDIIYLAAISIREEQVYKVCNFSQRKYVKSFPTMGYWLSMFPFISLFDRLIEQFCCLVLPDLFGRYTVDEFNQDRSFQGASPVQGSQFRQVLGLVQGQDLGALIRSFTNKSRTAAQLTSESTSQPAFTPPLTRRASVVEGISLVNTSVDNAETQLKEAGVEVRRAAYDPSDTPNIVSTLPGFFRQIRPGSAVTLYEENGQVRYYSVASADPSSELRAQVTSLSERLRARDTELQTLQSRIEEQKTTLDEVVPLTTKLADTERRLTERNEEIAGLRRQMQELESRQTEIAGERGARAKLAEVEAELKELREFREEVRKFMRRPPQ
ncbi:MAG TPA: DUF6519 domain-containing protein [Herpetosiphonaceae bacterium]